MRKKLFLKKWITREDLKNNPNKVFLFGDNAERFGLGGQAKEMRGEPNAIGIVTKISPSRYMTDSEYFYNVYLILTDFAKAASHDEIVLPFSGLGTGLAKLSEKAPMTNIFLESCIEYLKSMCEIIYWDKDAN